jgi:NAD(P)-dependent dehydrogenase (short-subunit alcohol dehydrogenase family)
VSLQGRSCVVAGAGRGIGAEVARALAREGACLVLAARTISELDGVVNETKAFNVDACAVQADVSNHLEADRVVRTALARYGRIDVLVDAAGIYGPIGRFWESDLEEWKRATEINLYGLLHLCHAAIPHMIEGGSGSIIAFSGGGATAPLPRFSAYGSTKAAVVRFVETIAEELRSTGVRVNAIAPGLVDTRLQDSVLAAREYAGDLFAKIQSLRDRGEGAVDPAVPAALAVFLASDESAGLTGRLISAPHDEWVTWDASRLEAIMELPWYTLRRLDTFTLKPFLDVGSRT